LSTDGFYDADCVLSLIAKFLVHLLGDAEGRVKLDGRDRRREEREVDSMEVREMELHEDIRQNATYFALWGRPLGATAPSQHFWKALFMGKIYLADNMKRLKVI